MTERTVESLWELNLRRRSAWQSHALVDILDAQPGMTWLEFSADVLGAFIHVFIAFDEISPSHWLLCTREVSQRRSRNMHLGRLCSFTQKSTWTQSYYITSFKAIEKPLNTLAQTPLSSSHECSFQVCMLEWMTSLSWSNFIAVFPLVCFHKFDLEPL